jgi:hypothetical protein
MTAGARPVSSESYRTMSYHSISPTPPLDSDQDRLAYYGRPRPEHEGGDYAVSSLSSLLLFLLSRISYWRESSPVWQ